ncbi:uncharacterized protein THITE_52692 [Thermothielavioides terrestris NRRL 8126]|uniref:Nitrate reductase [NADPH] n=1 Tax=Thermothielavioides terrestris (strain ATCC 38088 / NRRL 8126) TaxID=578455 RepID=G2R5W7_THETT|nr:uncharacterized protein THITE_52692 [Thermothielavioides terrestris NRRL 8126]AEO68354.1 hypothetical protein THITE_52692 [Thermothielavioides terrestris NRRL 8126]
MPHNVPWEVSVKDHPGSPEQDIRDEPDWIQLQSHAIGFKNRDGRRPGLTHFERDHEEEVEAARRLREELHHKIDLGSLVNFRDLIQDQPDFHLRHPENRSLGWRYVLETSEDWVKNKQKWPANIEKWEKEKQEAEKKKKEEEGKSKERGKQGEGKSQDEEKTPELTPQERALAETFRRESRYIASLKQNDGKQASPQTRNRSSVTIDEQDQFSPDNWLPRCPDLIRLTGKHPMNAEPPLIRLFEGGLITPNESHFVRNHGSVPRLLWEFHRLDIEHNGKTLSLTMDQLKERYKDRFINIPIAIACTGNRRKELNLLRKTKGANNAASSVACAYWKGPLVRDVLLSAGVPEKLPPSPNGTRYWVNFAGADSLSEGAYETSIPFDYVMDPSNDVLLALEMNDLPLPPDHGYPVRLMVPGWVGGRCVKWLRRIWLSDRETESYYHVWDNRVVPPFVRDKDGELAEALFRHPSTICNEQVLNSVVCRPAHGEKIALREVEKGAKYRVQGFAYNGAGHEVQQVEVSMDEGKSWLCAARQFPEYPIRHGNKFWTWLFWEVEVELADLVRAPSIMVRCWDTLKNTQPREMRWNILGMMNNAWYTVKTETLLDGDERTPAVIFRHPTEAASSSGGWMQPSEELRIAQAKQEAATPQKQFTREEIEKHDKEDDCWLVIDNKVYDVTSVLSWHPGGKAAIMGHAGQCHSATTEEFSSIHDDYAYQKLQECILGAVTKKTANFIKQTAEIAAKERAENAQQQGEGARLALQKHRWVPVKLIDRRSISKDTRTYTFELPPGKPELGLGTCQHIQVGFHLQDKMLVRPYTPTRPQPPTPPDSPTSTTSTANNNSNKPATFDLTVKTYFPTDAQPGGALSNLLDCMPLGEEVEIRGPTGDIVYAGDSEFLVAGAGGAGGGATRRLRFPRVSLVLGGSGITPGYALVARIAQAGGGDMTEVRAVDANRTEADILLREDLDRFERQSGGRIRFTHVLSHPGEGWRGEKGRVDAAILRKYLFPPGEGNVVFLCGPPGLVQKAALPALKEWGYVEDENMFGF